MKHRYGLTRRRLLTRHSTDLLTATLIILVLAGIGVVFGLAAAVLIGDADTTGTGANQPPSAPPAHNEVRPTPTPPPLPAPTATPAVDYRFEGYRLAATTTFCTNPDGGPPLDRPLTDLVAEAVAIWQEAAQGRLPLASGGLCPGTRPAQLDGVNVVGWGPVDGDAIAFAWPVTDGFGVVREADIVLDQSYSSLSDERCLLSVLLHEFGHIIGLDHQDQEPSIMTSATYCIPMLSPADVEAVKYLYP